MKNKDKRSLLLSMILGDGCLHYTSNKVSGAITVDHGIEQADYVTWKANLVSQITQRNVKTRQGHKGKSMQFSVCFKKFKAWRKFCYPNGKKSLNKILPFIKHPEFAFAIWLMDDGYVEPSIYEDKTTHARFRIFTESQPIEDHENFIGWFNKHLNITPKIHFYNCKKRKKKLPFLKFNQADSLLIWEKIRDMVLQFDSMKYKFRHIEEVYQSKILQRTPDIKSDDIVRHS